MSYTNSHIEATKERSSNQIRLSTGKQQLQFHTILNDLHISFGEIIKKIKEKGINSDKQRFNLFLTIFTPNLYFNKIDIQETRFAFVEQFHNKNNSQGDIITLNFCKFLIDNQDNVLSMNSTYKMIDFFRMCQVLL